MKQTNRWMMGLTIIAALCIVGWTSYGQGQNSSKKNWEYMSCVIGQPDQLPKELNQFGNDGWELVSVDAGWAYFKRAK